MSKGQNKNGVRLTINNSSPYSTMIITDIDVEPGIDTVILDIGNSLPPYVSGEVQLKKVNKQFPDVKTLIFGDGLPVLKSPITCFQTLPT